jgi:cytochrome c oxidase subunit 4
MSPTREHIVPRWIYIAVFFLLMALLLATYGIAQINLGRLNVVAALTIAVIKMLLVVLFFMEVRWSSRLTWIVIAAGFFWLLLLIGITMSDYLTRVPVTLPGA